MLAFNSACKKTRKHTHSVLSEKVDRVAAPCNCSPTRLKETKSGRLYWTQSFKSALSTLFTRSLLSVSSSIMTDFVEGHLFTAFIDFAVLRKTTWSSDKI